MDEERGPAQVPGAMDAMAGVAQGSMAVEHPPAMCLSGLGG